MTDDFARWAIMGNTGSLVAEVYTREEAEDIIDDLEEDIWWNDLAPFTIVDLLLKN